MSIRRTPTFAAIAGFCCALAGCSAAAGKPQSERLRLIAEVPLPGPARRFDYQSVDTATRRLYISHMDADRLLVFDLESSRVVGEVRGLPRATGVLAVAAKHRVFVSAPGAHEVVVIDDRTLGIVARIANIRFPDGIAYARAVDKVFVSDESGGSDVVIDGRTLQKRSVIALAGAAGNTQYDSVSGQIFVAVQTRNQLVTIDPVRERLQRRYNLPGIAGPHGFVIDQTGRRIFVSGADNAVMAVVDMRTMRVVQHVRVGAEPDVLAWDWDLGLLYVASEAGSVAIFQTSGDTLVHVQDLHAPHAHTVAVDPRTHRVYLPLENVKGRPVLRIYQPQSH